MRRNGGSSSAEYATVEELSTLKRDVQNKIRELEILIENEESKAKVHGIDLKSIVKFEFEHEIFDEKIKSLTDKNEASILNLTLVENMLDEKFESLNLQTKLQRCTNEIEEIQSQFSEDQKLFQAHLDSIEQWKKVKAEIEGSNDKIDSLLYLNNVLDYIDNKLTGELDDLREKRVLISVDIFNKKSEIKFLYDKIKLEIDSQLSTSKVSGLNIASTFHASSNFKESILTNIRQNRIGSFYGADEGKSFLQEQLITLIDWNDSKSIKDFLDLFIDHLENDRRILADKNNNSTYIGNTVKNRKDLYNYLFCLEYLEPHYDLQQNGKSLEQLSPGEKGALLLVFYLVLDKEDIPLIIDQPEDNLDNNSVAKVLVPFIKEAKKKRQIIIVTHNPNLAVVSDAEQVIRVSIDKENGNIFDFVSGGIENNKINKEIVEVLEGTIPAFNTRKDKYQGV